MNHKKILEKAVRDARRNSQTNHYSSRMASDAFESVMILCSRLMLTKAQVYEAGIRFLMEMTSDNPGGLDKDPTKPEKKLDEKTEKAKDFFKLYIKDFDFIKEHKPTSLEYMAKKAEEFPELPEAQIFLDLLNEKSGVHTNRARLW